MPTYLNIPALMNHTTYRLTEPPQKTLPNYDINALSHKNSCLQVYNHIENCPVCPLAYNLSELFVSKPVTNEFDWIFKDWYISPSLIILVVVFILMFFVLRMKK